MIVDVVSPLLTGDKPDPADPGDLTTLNLAELVTDATATKVAARLMREPAAGAAAPVRVAAFNSYIGEYANNDIE